MFEGGGIAVSLPAIALRDAPLPRSVFNAEALEAFSLSDELRQAIDIVVVAAARHNVPVKFVARPEIFTNGETLAWLRKELGETTDHLCISDGSSLRIIPGLRNHVFFYSLGRQSNSEAFHRLVKRAPDLFASLSTQVNSAFRFRAGSKTYINPDSVIIHDDSGNAQKAKRASFNFYMKVTSIEDAADRILSNQALSEEKHNGASIFIPLTEAATADKGFMKHAGAIISKAFFDVSSQVYLALPCLGSHDNSTRERVKNVLQGLRYSTAPIPRVQAKNVFLTVGDLSNSGFEVSNATLVLHESYEFWRHPDSYFQAFANVQILTPRWQKVEMRLADLFTEILGRAPQITRYVVPKTDWP
jgi:hypothetical protein